MFAPRLDTLKRRIRFSSSSLPKGKRIVIDENDIAMWTAIHFHGPLPTHYLDAFTTKKNYNTHQKRLTKQRWGTEENGPYLIRCSIDAPDPLATTNVYRLHKNAADILKQREIFSPLAIHSGWAIHQLMGSCVTASIELAAKAKGIGFIPRHKILAGNKKPMKLPLFSSPRKYLVPDELFGLDYGGTYRFFVCEWDRNSEPWERENTEGVDFVGKLKDYVDAMRHGAFKSNTKILIVTTTNARAKSTRDTLRNLDPKLAKNFSINVLEYFQKPWKMPPVLTEVLEPWQRADGTMHDLSKP